MNQTWLRCGVCGWYHKHPHALLEMTQVNGLPSYHIVCTQCGTKTGAMKKQYALDMIIEESAFIAHRQDNTDRAVRYYEPCAYKDCDALITHRHHWAPRNTFGFMESDNWPTAPLCIPHHTKWHAVMDGYRRTARGN